MNLSLFLFFRFYYCFIETVPIIAEINIKMYTPSFRIQSLVENPRSGDRLKLKLSEPSQMVKMEVIFTIKCTERLKT